MHTLETDISFLRPVLCPVHLLDDVPSIAFAHSTTPSNTDQDATFIALKDSVSIQIFKIQSNVQGIQRLVDKLGGNADGDNLRTSL